MTLADWQARLRWHFEDLRRNRTAAVGARPLFALEHGLEADEFQELATAVRTHVMAAPPSDEHSLPWIIYAAEVGYRYSGEEYWQTFEDETPGWAIHGDRDWIRSCYRRFQQTYIGAEPSGAWAEHFSIICWPITHAILPRDLQRQLARILYELRHSFSAELFESPSRLGEFIAARSWNATSRFQNLMQDPNLVGQIAAALLLEGEFGTRGLIHPPTLLRIGEDLDRERRAREWLRAARRFARERAQIHGLGVGRGAVRFAVRRPEEARAEVAALGVEPRLVLRPRDAGGTSWEVSLEIPDLSSLLFRFPETRETLTGSRCEVVGAAGRPLARGRCLHGAQRVTLARWPRVGQVLLRFDREDPQLDYLFHTECLLRPGPLWLFRIGSDGLAYELRSLRVRSGERYILVNNTRPFAPNNHIRAVELECEGVYGAILELPTALTARWENTLRQLGLVQAKSIEVWPAGLAAVVWDGEGHGEWLASETPCLALRSDHAIAALLVSMGSACDSPLEITSIPAGETVFVELPQLPIGLHTVHVATRSAVPADADSLGDLDVVMRVREARPWSPGVSPHGPLIVQIDPAEPTVEQIWEGHVELSIRGPAGRTVNCSASLFDTEGGEATVVRQLPPLGLPITPDRWKRHFESCFQRRSEVQAAYDTARVCQIEFGAEELGSFTVRCVRESTPLRWAVRHNDQERIARLLDDSGSPTPPVVARFAFETPSVEERLNSTRAYTIPSPGGLYVARRGEFTAAVVIPPLVRGLADLGCTPRIAGQARSTESVVGVLALAQVWRQAKLPGELFSAMRQRTVLRAFASHVFRLIGGESWAAAELSECTGEQWLAGLSQATSKRRDEASIGEILAADCSALATISCVERVERIAKVAARFQLLPSGSFQRNPSGVIVISDDNPNNADDPRWLVEFALRLASTPADLRVWAGQQLHRGISQLLDRPTLARAARFVVLATDHYLQSRAAPGETYAGWAWP